MTSTMKMTEEQIDEAERIFLDCLSNLVRLGLSRTDAISAVFAGLYALAKNDVEKQVIKQHCAVLLRELN